ncbi:nuclear transport factor 2 family protein [Kordia sp.]|uniref:nuclear transport factor 2 family protein n=1 Tax=Kordia sp. TaxID=1965332 RepID=UPI003B58F373
MKKILFVLLCGFTLCSFAQKTSYYRHLRYNHVSPYIDIVGIHPIDKATASNTSHYVFTYDAENRLQEIINNHYHTEKVHPLASLGVYRVVFEYSGGKETRTFFDPNGKQISNDRSVFKEVYTFDEAKNKIELRFFDLANKPMESNWEIARYTWKKTAKFVVEKRFNLQDTFVDISPYFPFGITGIAIDENGKPKGHYNLNETLEITENIYGVASYQDQYDELGNHITYTYHNKNNDLVMNQWGYAAGKKRYDELGNFIKLELFDTKNKRIAARNIYSNSNVQLSENASEEDKTAIRNVSLGYLAALEKLKPKLMAEVLSEDLQKVTFKYDRDLASEYIQKTTKEQMVAYAKNWNKSGMQFPFNPTNTIEIQDVYGNIASVKLTSDNWVEYLQLIKTNGKWQIVNLIWQHKDMNRYKRK